MQPLRIIPQGTRGAEELQRLLKMNAGLDPLQQVAAAVSGLTAPLLDERLKLFVTQDPAMLRIKDYVRKLASRNEPVLITGPSGTGKELIARALGAGRAGPFIPVNCGGLATNLVPSIFFGYKRGAYTGATEDRPGVLIDAKDGTVFLDEIGDFPLDLQATLLRAIQEGKVVPVGATQEVKIQCRFIAATKYNLRQQVEAGKFREDLFARLYTYELRLSGLGERPDDIPLIARALGWPEDLEIPPAALDDISKFNVRGVETLIARHEVFGTY